MRSALVAAWAVGLGLLTWRQVREFRRPVPPGRYAAASGIFIALALLASYQPAQGAATAAAWGFDLAILLKPGLLPGTAPPRAQATAAPGGQPAPQQATLT